MRMRSRLAVAFALLCSLASCTFTKSEKSAADAGSPLAGAGVGMACGRSSDCRSGLSCAAGACAATGIAIQGAACILSDECTRGYYCSPEGACVAVGTKPIGARCTSDGDCTAGLSCAMDGLSGLCSQPGTKDFGQGCLGTGDCLAGLTCAIGRCTKASYLPAWPGAACEARAEVLSKAYFHVPRAADPASDTDFYRLPFPNDIRRKGGIISMKGHPRPGPRLLSFDLVDRYLTAIESEPMGFGANQAVYFRFSRDPDIASMAAPGAIQFVDVTPTSPTYGLGMGMTWEFASARTSYLCERNLVVRPSPGAPLRPGTTYAVMLSSSILDILKTPYVVDEDFTALLADTPPGDPDMAAAHAAYAPLRAYLAAGKADPTALLVATVFTVDAYEDPLAAVAAAVAAGEPATVANVIRCGTPAAGPHPCDDGKTGPAHTRGCPETLSPLFDEYQGTVSLPVFQQGKPPYLSPTDGGGIAIANGQAQLVRREPVCFSLTVPKGTPPATGFPLVVYAHGTGGSYRSFVGLGLAEEFAAGAVGIPSVAGNAAAVPMAMLGYDGVLHGTRKGESTKDEGELVYNFLNPVAARDTALQAAADLLALPQALAGLSAAGVALDGKKLAVYGHSQGGNAASLVATQSSPYTSFVLSGTGGLLLYTLTGKTSPVNVPAFLPYALGEITAKLVREDHPVLNLMQMYFERSDSVNFARRIASEPKDAAVAKHVLHVVGTQDSYSVVPTQMFYAIAGRYPLAAPGIAALAAYGLEPQTPPLRNNWFFGHYGNLTMGQVQYDPAPGKEGHFVSTDVAAARRSIKDFLGTGLRDGVPAIVP